MTARLPLAFPFPAATLLALTAVAGGCTVTTVSGDDELPAVRSRGLIDGHIAAGFRDEDRFLHVEVLDSRSPGGVAELVVWKLLRLEIGLAGAAVGVGPLDVGLGTVFFEPRMPRYERRDHEHDERPEGERNAEGIDAARRARGG